MRHSCAIAVLLLAAGCAGGGEDTEQRCDGGATARCTGGSGGSGGAGGIDTTCGAASGGARGGGELVDGEDAGWEPAAPAALDCPLDELDRPDDCGAEHGFFSTVRGWVVMPGGQPIEGAKAQLCVHTSTRQFICLKPADTDANGVYTVELPEEVQCLDKVAMRVLQPGAGRATTYCQMDAAAGPVVRLHEPTVLPLLPPAIDLPPEGDPEAARFVAFEDGLELEVVPSLYYSGTGTYERFAGRRIPTDAVGLCGDAPSFDGLFALYPEGTISAPGFALRFPNDGGLPAGTAVDLFVLGGLDCRLLDGKAVPEATWAKFSDGIVSDDGATIASAEGAGLPCFTWVGYRVKG